VLSLPPGEYGRKVEKARVPFLYVKRTDIAYLVGALRDGSVFHYRRNYTCVWYETSYNFLRRSIGSRLEKIFGKKPKLLEYKPGQWRIRTYSQKAHDLFVNEFGFKSPQEFWGTPKPVKLWNGPLIASYVAGFFDAEGDVSKKEALVGFSQKNVESLEFIKNWLEKHGIRTSRIVVADKKSQTMRFYISSRREVEKFRRLVPFEHPEKISLLKRVLQHT
jgi:intein-encoded DNA endonuclease-like protein